eukprot:12306-Heterococcus_DN1.PRE.2
MNQIFDTERVVVVVWVASAAAQGEQAAPENLAAPSMLLCMQERSACCEARKRAAHQEAQFHKVQAGSNSVGCPLEP